jgi:hypothetical protein
MGTTRFRPVPHTAQYICVCVCVCVNDRPQTAGVYLGLFDWEQVIPSKLIHVAMHLICILEIPFRIFAGTPAVLTYIFRDFAQSHQEYPGIIPWNRPWPLPSLFQFIIYKKYSPWHVQSGLLPSLLNKLLIKLFRYTDGYEEGSSVCIAWSTPNFCYFNVFLLYGRFDWMMRFLIKM